MFHGNSGGKRGGGIIKESKKKSGRNKEESKKSDHSVHDDNTTTFGREEYNDKRSKAFAGRNEADESSIFSSFIDDLRSRDECHDALTVFYYKVLRVYNTRSLNRLFKDGDSPEDILRHLDRLSGLEASKMSVAKLSHESSRAIPTASMTKNEKRDALMVSAAFLLCLGDHHTQTIQNWGCMAYQSFSTVLQKIILCHVTNVRLSRGCSVEEVRGISEELRLDDVAYLFIKDLVNTLFLLLKAEPYIFDETNTPIIDGLLSVTTELVGLLVATAAMIHSSAIGSHGGAGNHDNDEGKTHINLKTTISNARILSVFIDLLLPGLAALATEGKDKVKSLNEKILFIYAGMGNLDSGRSEHDTSDDSSESPPSAGDKDEALLTGYSQLAPFFGAVKAAIISTGLLAERYFALFENAADDDKPGSPTSTAAAIREFGAAPPKDFSLARHLHPWIRASNTHAFADKEKRSEFSKILRDVTKLLAKEDELSREVGSPTSFARQTDAICSVPTTRQSSPSSSIKIGSQCIHFHGFSYEMMWLPLLRGLFQDGFNDHIRGNMTVRRILDIPQSFTVLKGNKSESENESDDEEDRKKGKSGNAGASSQSRKEREILEDRERDKNKRKEERSRQKSRDNKNYDNFNDDY